MTDQEINIAIAEACGWKLDTEFDRCSTWVNPNGTYMGDEKPPNYCNDLNAMHEAEKHLASNLQWNLYTSHLATLCGWNSEIHNTRTMTNVICSATARQRAEAFLRTLNLWKE